MPDSNRRKLWFFVLMQGAFGLLGIALFFILKIPRQVLRFEMGTGAWSQAFLYSLPMLGMGFAFTSPWGRELPPMKNIITKLSESPFMIFLNRGSVFMFFVVSLVAGLTEEFTFRGVLQYRIGLWAASLIFGLLHFVTPGYFAIATAIGLYLGWVFQMTTLNLFPVMFIHALYDFVVLLLLQRVLREAKLN